MRNAMTYQGYSARVEFADERGIFTGRIAGNRDGVGFHADTVEGLRAAFAEAVEDYLETCAAVGRDLQRGGTVGEKPEPVGGGGVGQGVGVRGEL